jgi:hypothetical protein
MSNDVLDQVLIDLTLWPTGAALQTNTGAFLWLNMLIGTGCKRQQRAKNQQ